MLPYGSVLPNKGRRSSIGAALATNGGRTIFLYGVYVVANAAALGGETSS